MTAKALAGRTSINGHKRPARSLAIGSASGKRIAYRRVGPWKFNNGAAASADDSIFFADSLGDMLGKPVL
jgi:hypothetical protein